PPAPQSFNSLEPSYCLFTEPDAKGVIAVPYEGTNPLLRWRSGTWTSFPLDAAIKPNQPRINGAAPRPDGIWLNSAARGLYFLPYEANDRNPAPPHYNQFGKYRLQSIRTLLSLPNGSTLVAAMNASDNSRKFAWFLQDPKGNVSQLERPELAPDNLATLRQRIAPVAPLTDNLLWIKGNPRAQTSLFDLADNRILHTIPHWQLSEISAVMHDGTLFFRSANNLYAYHPDARDTRPTLQPSHTIPTTTDGILTSDGTYWFAQQPNIAARFDGNKIESFPNIPLQNFRPSLHDDSVIPGYDGFIINAKTAATLVSPRGSITENSLENLIAKHPTQVAQTFTKAHPVTNYGHPTHIQTDSNGNLWLLRNRSRELKVFTPTNNQWLNANDALAKAGAPDGQVLYLLSLSTKILAINPIRQEAKSIFFLSVENNQIKVEPRNEIFLAFSYPSNHIVYSPRGEPWINITSMEPDKNANYSCRYTDTGPAQKLSNLTPIAIDADDVMLARNAYSTTFKQVNDEIITELPDFPAPQFRERISFIAPGIICQPTQSGIQLTALQDPTNPIIYNLDIPAQPTRITCSPRGFAAVHVSNTSPPNLYFFPLKKP
ncbi:MAG: hypothetical protein FWD53_08165, partial [Phycisphaerales bacterium]|nr:hypothetical protein [Phycisphaerales bacterium]